MDKQSMLGGHAAMPAGRALPDPASDWLDLTVVESRQLLGAEAKTRGAWSISD